VIFSSARLLGSRGDFSKVKTRAMVQIFLAIGKRLLSVAFRPWAGRIAKIV
jgi:hypothetical protein